MNTTHELNLLKISSILLLIGMVSLAIAGRGQLFTSLRNLNHGLSAAAGETLSVRSDMIAQESLAAVAPVLLLLNADALVLPIESGAAQLTARVRDADGKPVAGVEVHFTTMLGAVNPASVTTDSNGVAAATYTAGGGQGQAVVTAEAGGLKREAAIQLVKPDANALAHTLTLEFGASKLEPNQEVPVSAVLRDASGQPVAGELVSLFGSLGVLTPASALSDASGRVTAVYRAGSAQGQAMITALAGYASQSVAFQVGDPASPQEPGQPSEHFIFLPSVAR